MELWGSNFPATHLFATPFGTLHVERLDDNGYANVSEFLEK